VLIGVVPQHPYLFNATLRENLLLADGEADDDAIVDACERAALGSFLRSLPAGLDTPVGERGMQLSGGERQRVAIARLFLRAAPIVILDEATANLDRATARTVLRELDRFAEGRTLIVVSHRPEPLAKAGDGRLGQGGGKAEENAAWIDQKNLSIRLQRTKDLRWIAAHHPV